MSEEGAPYITCVKRADSIGHPLDAIAEEVHKAWMEESARQGRVAPGTTKCLKCGRELEEILDYDRPRKLKHLHCRHCIEHYFEHPDMVPYEQLSEPVKDYDRATVWAVLSAIKTKEVENNINRDLFSIIAAIADQCGGEIIIEEKCFIRRGTIGLDFKRNPATNDMEITLHEGKRDEKP